MSDPAGNTKVATLYIYEELARKRMSGGPHGKRPDEVIIENFSKNKHQAISRKSTRMSRSRAHTVCESSHGCRDTGKLWPASDPFRTDGSDNDVSENRAHTVCGSSRGRCDSGTSEPGILISPPCGGGIQLVYPRYPGEACCSSTVTSQAGGCCINTGPCCSSGGKNFADVIEPADADGRRWVEPSCIVHVVVARPTRRPALGAGKRAAVEPTAAGAALGAWR